ncbi:MAG: radical SAM protein [Thermodesulfobacteriota bacterium]
MDHSPPNAVVLINPQAEYAAEVAQKCYPPMGLLYLAAALRDEGFAPHVIDANAFVLSDAAVAARVAQARPLVTGIPVYTEILPKVASLIRAVHAAWPGARIVLGGPHATAVPEKTLAQFPLADFVLAGEAERTLPMLCRAAEKDEGFWDVPGLHFREDGRTLQGPAHKLPEVSRITPPARDLVEDGYREKRYHSLLVRRRPVDTLFTSRGCPFSCGFCYNFRHRYRARAPEDVLAELSSIRSRGIRDVEITDDTFTVDEGRALDIFRLIRSERLGLSFRIKSRVDVFSERIARGARAAGVYLVAFGAESADQRILDAMNKKITVSQIADSIALAKKYRLASHTSWVVGYPGETPESIEAMVRFIGKARPTTANIAVLRPYPDTAVYCQARDAGTLTGDWNPETGEIPWVRLPWAPSRKTLEEACSRALHRVYLRPYYVGAFAWMIASNMNTTLFRYAWQESKKALRHKLTPESMSGLR